MTDTKKAESRAEAKDGRKRFGLGKLVTSSVAAKKKAQTKPRAKKASPSKK